MVPTSTPRFGLLIVCIVLTAGCAGFGGTPSSPTTAGSPTGVEDTTFGFAPAYAADEDGTPDYFEPEADTREATRVVWSDGHVTVSGLTVGIGDRNCIDVRLTEARAVNGTTLHVVVENDATVPSDRSGCNGTAAPYEYRAELTVSGSAPERVVVTHRDAETGETQFESGVLRARNGTVVSP
ncbi:hypothetical protein [Halomarina oriensis]|uniref:Uncharacterized protein n=1 Tax=Halomarina oriensis TaxID=671145 RepID=A0A6B0GK14_9EURY|nr:hypothetical protein [Halomarina oriensis]MWG34940.1 hypothetical protein [Halomarina oriensis]